jgi:RNA polymerase sigma-70 factor, ECF subfamily
MRSLLDEIETAIPPLRRYARALLRDADLADDLVQDCLERTLDRLPTLRAEGSIRAWMFRILLNLARDGRRRRAQLHFLPLSEAPQLAASGGQEDHLELERVHAAMGRLPDDQRAALLLVALEGMSLAKAAEVLDIPVGTLVSRLARARAALREMTGRPRKQPLLREVIK